MRTTTAHQFVSEVIVWNYLRDNGLEVPEILSQDAMRHRYIVQAMRVESDDSQRPIELEFQDGSIAVRCDNPYRWECKDER